MVIILFLVWEMPQNLFGLLLLALLSSRVSVIEFCNERAFIEVNGFGVSLGTFIFWSRYLVPTGYADNRQHEYGHALQSKILGPFYIPLIGIPSLMRNIYGRWYSKLYKREWQGYHHGFPEKWANNLGRRYYPAERQSAKK